MLLWDAVPEFDGGTHHKVFLFTSLSLITSDERGQSQNQPGCCIRALLARDQTREPPATKPIRVKQLLPKLPLSGDVCLEVLLQHEEAGPAMHFQAGLLGCNWTTSQVRVLLNFPSCERLAFNIRELDGTNFV